MITLRTRYDILEAIARVYASGVSLEWCAPHLRELWARYQCAR